MQDAQAHRAGLKNLEWFTHRPWQGSPSEPASQGWCQAAGRKVHRRSRPCTPPRPGAERPAGSGRAC